LTGVGGSAQYRLAMGAVPLSGFVWGVATAA
jgi:hypothetical protein